MHTFICFDVPSTTTYTFWMFGYTMRFVTRCEWLTLRPAAGCLPHTVHTWDIVKLLSYVIGPAQGQDRTGRKTHR